MLAQGSCSYIIHACIYAELDVHVCTSRQQYITLSLLIRFQNTVYKLFTTLACRRMFYNSNSCIICNCLETVTCNRVAKQTKSELDYVRSIWKFSYTEIYTHWIYLLTVWFMKQWSQSQVKIHREGQEISCGGPLLISPFSYLVQRKQYSVIINK